MLKQRRGSRLTEAASADHTKYGMWQVLEHRRAQRRLDRLPDDILKRYEKWKDVVVMSGPPGLRLIKGFHDEALTGPWKGCRSSRLSIKYRVIYQVVREQVMVQVLDVTPHDYRRR